MEQHFPKFPKQRSTSKAIPKFSKEFSRKFSFHSTLLLELLESSVERFAFRKFNSFQNVRKLFGEISVTFAIVSNFSIACEYSRFSLLLAARNLSARSNEKPLYSKANFSKVSVERKVPTATCNEKMLFITITFQFQNESLSTRLQQELANREEVEHK